MYTEELKIYSVNERVNTTHFTKNFVESIPNLKSGTLHVKIQLIFNNKGKDLVGGYVKCFDDIFLSTRSVVSPIWKKMAQQSNQFDGSFHGFSQFDSEVTTLSYHQF